MENLQDLLAKQKNVGAMGIYGPDNQAKIVEELITYCMHLENRVKWLERKAGRDVKARGSFPRKNPYDLAGRDKK